MHAQNPTETSSAPILRRYQGYGVFGGIALGFLVGILISGPYFYEWSAAISLAVICGCAAGGAFMGWVALGIAAGSLAGGGGWDVGHRDGDAPAGGDAGGGDD